MKSIFKKKICVKRMAKVSLSSDSRSVQPCYNRMHTMEVWSLKLTGITHLLLNKFPF